MKVIQNIGVGLISVAVFVVILKSMFYLFSFIPKKVFFYAIDIAIIFIFFCLLYVIGREVSRMFNFKKN